MCQSARRRAAPERRKARGRHGNRALGEPSGWSPGPGPEQRAAVSRFGPTRRRARWVAPESERNLKAAARHRLARTRMHFAGWVLRACVRECILECTPAFLQSLAAAPCADAFCTSAFIAFLICTRRGDVKLEWAGGETRRPGMPAARLSARTNPSIRAFSALRIAVTKKDTKLDSDVGQPECPANHCQWQPGGGSDPGRLRPSQVTEDALPDPTASSDSARPPSLAS